MFRMFSILIFIVGFYQISYSQNEDTKDVLHLKNGKIISGIILKQEFGVISIKVNNNNQEEKILQIQQYEISKIIMIIRKATCYKFWI